MPQVGIPFAASTAQWVGAASAIVAALIIALLVDRLLGRRGHVLDDAVARGQLRPETGTRLRFVRRLLVALIVMVGAGVALSQFTGLGEIAASLLASGAIAAAIIGFAARSTLANLVAGIMLAVTQPLRVGDWVTFEDTYGEVEDVRLNYTVLRTGAERRVLIPNEKLASGILINDTLISASVGLEVAVWLPARADADRAVAALGQEADVEASVAEAVPWGVRLTVEGPRCAPPERAEQEAELRARCLRRLRSEGLLDA